MTRYHGFFHANYFDSEAWFHTEEAAHRYAKSCGWTDYDVSFCYEPNPGDIMDTPEQPWGAAVKEETMKKSAAKKRAARKKSAKKKA